MQQEQLQRRRRFGALDDTALGVQHHLPCGMNVRQAEARCLFLPHAGLVIRQFQHGQRLVAGLADQEKHTPDIGQFPQEKADVHPLIQQAAQQQADIGAVLRGQRVQQADEHFLSGQPQHFAGAFLRQACAAQRQRLIQQGHAVPHAAGGPFGDEAHGPFLKGHPFLFQHTGQMADDGGFRQVAENEMLTPADNGDGKFVRLGGGEDENHARRRLFQRFQQRIEGGARKHVGFVNDENLVAAFHGGVANFFAQGTGVFHAVVGGAVNFGDIHMDALRDFAALFTLVAGGCRGGVHTVERLGKNAGDGGFAHAARAAKKIGRSHFVLGGGAGQNGLDHVLTGDLGKGLGAVTRSERCVLHGAGKGGRPEPPPGQA